MTGLNTPEDAAQRILAEPCEHSASSHCVACAAALIRQREIEAKIEALAKAENDRWRFAERHGGAVKSLKECAQEGRMDTR